MAGSGSYEIPVSISDAKTSASPLNQQAGTYFIFSSPNTTLSGFDQTQTTKNPATATSSAALGGNASSSTAGSGVDTPSGSNTLLYVIGGVSVLISLVGLYFVLKHKG